MYTTLASTLTVSVSCGFVVYPNAASYTVFKGLLLALLQPTEKEYCKACNCLPGRKLVVVFCTKNVPKNPTRQDVVWYRKCADV